MISQALEANGAIVYILGRRKEALEKAAGTAVSVIPFKQPIQLSDHCHQKHSNIHPIQADVTSKSDLENAVSHIASKSGYVNLVVANSGVAGPSLKGLSKDASLASFRSHLWNWDFNDFTNTYAVNSTAVFYTVVAFLELLDKGNKAGNVTQRSQVIAISSIGGFNRVPLAGYPYGSSKAAAIHMMKQFATTLVPYDIRSNCIAPGGEC